MPGPSSLHANKRGSGAPPQDGPVNKRSRVSRACDQCRTAREKCDGQPTCSTCSASKRPCTYTANPKKRGIQPGYIRTLELALTWLFKNSDAESLLTQELCREGRQSALLGKDTSNKESNKLHRTWRKSRFCKDVDRLLSGNDIDEQPEPVESEDEPSEEEVEDAGLAPEMTPIVADSGTIIEAQQQPATLVTQPQPVHASTGLTQLPSSRWQLFDVYFAYTHSWFPIAEKHDVLRLSYSYPNQGLCLTSSMPESGEHAELWGILALASVQECALSRNPNSMPVLDSAPDRLYSVARSLIPLELGTFQLGHVKALLLLALVNISQLEVEAAWLLVGYASRILQHSGIASTNLRFKHAFYGCFLLDTVLSMQLDRSPYLQLADIERIGKIDPDGLEEWQPWAGNHDPRSSLPPPSRTPVLSLSTFNNIVELTSILIALIASGQSNSAAQAALGRLDMWKASLSSNFAHVCSDRFPVPHTPPASLLQILHCMCDFTTSPQSPVQRIVKLLESIRKNMGIGALPPIVFSLLHLLSHNRCYDNDYGSRNRLQTFHADMARSWSHKVGYTNQPNLSLVSPMESMQSLGPANMQVPTPESLQISFNPPLVPMESAERPRTSSTLLDDILPDMSTGLNSQSIALQGSLPDFSTSHCDSFDALLPHRNSMASRDIENFFDELASLDGAERLENQPQFMQNLGFAPDANIADLLSSGFVATNPLPQVYHQHSNDTVPFDQAHFFNAG